ncbi:hypothetical protein [uncultured Mobiluncus sp.]|uniref:hypothetical protein n=1 Tax=uncultured Mobiluncus sp. TaxID=293425 RepID=UPI0025FB69B5|nr:hypothetical protein [uncultured Mobiluncus sp.]
MNKYSRILLLILGTVLFLAGCQTNTPEPEAGTDMPNEPQAAATGNPLPADIDHCYVETVQDGMRLVANAFEYPGGYDQLFQGTLEQDDAGCIMLRDSSDNELLPVSFPYGTTVSGQSVKLPWGSALAIGDRVRFGGAVDVLKACQDVANQETITCPKTGVLRVNDSADSVDKDD